MRMRSDAPRNRRRFRQQILSGCPERQVHAPPEQHRREKVGHPPRPPQSGRRGVRVGDVVGRAPWPVRTGQTVCVARVSGALTQSCRSARPPGGAPVERRRTRRRTARPAPDHLVCAAHAGGRRPRHGWRRGEAGCLVRLRRPRLPALGRCARRGQGARVLCRRFPAGHSDSRRRRIRAMGRPRADKASRDLHADGGVARAALPRTRRGTVGPARGPSRARYRPGRRAALASPARGAHRLERRHRRGVRSRCVRAAVAGGGAGNGRRLARAAASRAKPVEPRRPAGNAGVNDARRRSRGARGRVRHADRRVGRRAEGRQRPPPARHGAGGFRQDPPARRFPPAPAGVAVTHGVRARESG